MSVEVSLTCCLGLFNKDILEDHINTIHHVAFCNCRLVGCLRLISNLIDWRGVVFTFRSQPLYSLLSLAACLTLSFP